MLTGEAEVGFTTVPGAKAQLAPVIFGLKLQLRDTL
jgi:hypothetical protein